MNNLASALAIVGTLIPLTAGAQPPASRFELGPVARMEKVWLEGGATGTLPVAGLAGTFRVSPRFGIEADFTKAENDIGRSYEGGFFSFPESPNPTREEIEARAVVARRSLAYVPGIGGSIAFTATSTLNSRASFTVLAGIAARRYVESSTMTVLKIPEGVDPALATRNLSDSRSVRGRGGLLLGFHVPIAATHRLKIAPELRYVYGGPAFLRHKYRVLDLGLRFAWSL